MVLSDSIKCVKKVETLIKEAPNKIGQTIINKMKSVMLKNKGFTILSNIAEILSDNGTRGEDIPEDLPADDINYFKYAPITSVDVERSFSLFKNLLTDRLRRLSFENIRHILIVQCNGRFLATGTNFSGLHFDFRISKSTINGIVRETCEVLWLVFQPTEMPEPDKNKWIDISEGFY